MCAKQVEVISKSLIGRKSHAVKQKEGSVDLNDSCSYTYNRKPVITTTTKIK